MKVEKPPIASYSAVLADTSLFCRIEETLTFIGLLKLLDHFDARLKIVTDVNRELAKHERGRHRGLTVLKTVQMKGEFLRGRAEQLPPALAVKVGQIAPTFPDAKDSGNPSKNFGEVATALLAREMGFVAVIDDGNGQKFAHRQGVVTYTTRDVAVELAAEEVLTDDDAATLWAAVFRTKGERKHFDAAVAAARANVRAGSGIAPASQ